LILLDTGAFYALIDRNDFNHKQAKEFIFPFTSLDSPTPWNYYRQYRKRYSRSNSTIPFSMAFKATALLNSFWV
jgi:predicted nucleic acid-binding protein